MSARFELKLSPTEHRGLLACAARADMSAAAVCRLGLRLAKNKLNVLAAGGAEKTGRDIQKFLAELRANSRLAPLVPQCEEALAAMEFEGDGNPAAAALYDLIGLACAEPWPLPEKIRLLADLMEFEGKLVIRRLPDLTPVHQDGAN
jgi:hypothetical protein